MKHLLLLAPMLACLVSCQDAPTTSAAPTAEPTLAKQAPPSADSAKPAAAKPEYIESDMLTVNGQLIKELTTSQLVRQLGRPDKIEKGAVECGAMLASLNKVDSPDGDFWYYGNTMYEVNGNDAILSTFDVTTGKFQGKLGQLILNQKTTLEDVRRIFPVSAKQADVPSTGQPGEEMSLPFYYKGEQTDEYLNLVFKKGRLQKVDFFSPC
jgi:hypothetical protein